LVFQAGAEVAFISFRTLERVSGKFLTLSLISLALLAPHTAKATGQIHSCADLFVFAESMAHSRASQTVVAQKVEQRATGTVSNAEIKAEIKALIDLSHLDKQPDAVSSILGERHSLNSFLFQDAKDNLAVSSPLNVMNAAQRMLALVYSQGVKKTRMQLTGEEVDIYPFFSGGSSLLKGTRIVGNEKVIDEFVGNLKAQATGDRSGASIILLVGSAGTGKSEALKLLGRGAEILTSSADPKFASHTFQWVNLGEIAALQKFIPVIEINGKRTYADIDAPLGDSPFVLFPTEIQKIILEKGRAHAAQLIDGMEPRPWTTPDPISAFIRNEIIQHYSAQRGHALSSREIVEVLNHHVVVKRQILGQGHGKMPMIDAQGNDIDVQGLFMTPNPVVKFASGAGPTHVMSWYLNGKILTGHGNAVLFDEFFRNPAELRDMLLGAFESRVLSVGGAPSVPFDAVMIAATNTANLDKVRSSPEGEASADRFKIQAMRWSLWPNKIGELLLSMKSSDLSQQSLNDGEQAPVTGANLDVLFPRVQGMERVQGPDYRFRVWSGEGPTKVQIAPHALQLMAEIISASRMQLDPNKAEKVFSGKILSSNLLRNPIDRLRLYEGLRPDVTTDELRELVEVGQLLKEGETGISARDAGRWLTSALKAARSARSGYTLTPGVVLKVFRDSLTDGSISTPSHKERLRWRDLATEVTAQLLIPRLDADISKALANGDRVVQDSYFDILDEMSALDQNEGAASYVSSSNGQERSIDRARLEAIKEIYVKKNGRSLSLSQIAFFHSRQREVAGGAGRVPDESLLDAIASYFAGLHSKIAGFSSLVEYQRTGSGSDEVRAVHQSLVSALKQMGYNEIAIRDALMLVNNFRSQNEQSAP
jgi:predicted Ser/Thr protein kinase